MLTQSVLSILLVAFSCVEPFDGTFRADTKIIIVDARLTTDSFGNYVYLYESMPASGNSAQYLPLGDATVKVTVNDQEQLILSETTKGMYLFPEGITGKVGSSYQLHITAGNLELLSKKEIIPSGSPLKSIRHAFDKEGIKDLKGNLSPSQKIYIDTDDPADEQNFYMWDWTLYEEQFWCKSCENGRYFRDAASGPLGECREERFRRGILDYQCDSRCWEIFKTDEVNILKDDFVNGKTITDRQVANLPIYQLIGALLDIRQHAITKTAYEYLNLVQTQGQNTGGLADTPPASLAGNVSCISHPDQPVAGYFIVSSLSQQLHWLDRKDVPAETHFLGLLNGRRPNPEPMEMDLTRPPLAPCVNGATRTSVKPAGWYDFGANDN